MTAASKISSKDTAEHELDAIRSILTEEEAPAPRRTLRRAKPVEAELPRHVAPLRSKANSLPPLYEPLADNEIDSPQKPEKRRFSLRRSPKVAVAKAEAPRQQRADPRAEKQSGQGRVGKVKGFKLKPAYVALAVFVLLVVLRPWLVLGLLFLSLMIMTGVFLIVGYDGFWQGAMKFGRWYARRRPARAAIMHARMDRFAMRWDAVLDRFPEGTVDGLYLPDFGEMASAESRHSEAMDRRLAGLHGKGA